MGSEPAVAAEGAGVKCELNTSAQYGVVQLRKSRVAQIRLGALNAEA